MIEKERKENLRKYLVEKGLLKEEESVDIREIEGGIVNVIYRVIAGKKRFIVKQFLDSLKINPNIKLDIKRFFYEKASIQYLDKVMDTKITPDVYLFDEKNKIICMNDLGVGRRLDNMMFSGNFDPKIFTVIGKMIAEMHNKSMNNHSLSILFDNSFQDIKIYHRYYQTMNIPELVKSRDELINNSKKNRITYLHNDLKLNNFFIRENHIHLIDYEGAYYGDPAFEIGYFLGHLFLYFFDHSSELFEDSIRNFWDTYISELNFQYKQKLEENIVRHIGFIMIYKLLGIAKSDFNFIKDIKVNYLINIAKKIILSDNKKVKPILSIVKDKKK